MNFLAHAYLSFNDEEILVGNMISDFVKGKAQYNYPKNIHKGIVLHRRIDAFTDNHPAIAAAKKIFQPYYRLYSGAIMDIILDHFLANDKNEFSDTSLKDFTENVYSTLESFSTTLPPRFVAMLPYMRSENWLYHYKEDWGISRSLQGLVRRASFLTDHQTAMNLFEKDYQSLQTCYDSFFPDVKNFTKHQISNLD